MYISALCWSKPQISVGLLWMCSVLVNGHFRTNLPSLKLVLSAVWRPWNNSSCFIIVRPICRAFRVIRLILWGLHSVFRQYGLDLYYKALAVGIIWPSFMCVGVFFSDCYKWFINFASNCRVIFFLLLPRLTFIDSATRMMYTYRHINRHLDFIATQTFIISFHTDWEHRENQKHYQSHCRSWKKCRYTPQTITYD